MIGEPSLEALTVEDTHTGHRDRIDARALFVFIGAVPATRWLADTLALDTHGFIHTGAEIPHPSSDYDALMLESSRRGIFAAGDVRSGSVKRVAAAVGDGAMAVRLVHERLQYG